MFATMRVVTDYSVGTGFVVARVAEGGRRFFLITNKHVLGTERADRDKLLHLTLHFNVGGEDLGDIRGDSRFLELRPAGNPIWRGHPEPDADVVAIELTGALTDLARPRINHVTYDDFITPEEIESWFVTLGDDVLSFGYPDLAVTHADTNLPIVRTGVIASNFAEPLRLREEFSWLPGALSTCADS